jgi:hypothetical protein
LASGYSDQQLQVERRLRITPASRFCQFFGIELIASLKLLLTAISLFQQNQFKPIHLNHAYSRY